MRFGRPTSAPSDAPLRMMGIPACAVSTEPTCQLPTMWFTSLLLPFQQVPEVFEEPFRPYRFRIPRAADCLICQARPSPSSTEELDVALDQALARLGDE